jgi:hypothetical protein
MNSARSPRSSYLNFKPGTTRALSAIALTALHGWFLLKFLLVQRQPALELWVGGLALLGMVTAVLVFLSAYNFQAHAPKGQIDERELSQRNEAYFRTHQYMIGAILIGLLIKEFWERATGSSLSVNQLGNFLTVLFFSGMVMPATVLAWQDREDRQDQLD